MSTLEKFEKRHQEKPTDQAERILFGVLDDLIGRKGFDSEWDGLDDGIKEELLTENLEIVRKNLR